jgi:hypothetical protein
MISDQRRRCGVQLCCGGYRGVWGGRGRRRCICFPPLIWTDNYQLDLLGIRRSRYWQRSRTKRRHDAAVSTGGPRAGVDSAGAATPASFGSEGTGSGAEAGGGTNSAISTVGAGPGIDEACSRVAGAIASASFGSGEAGNGSGAEAGGGTDAAPVISRPRGGVGAAAGRQYTGTRLLQQSDRF